MSKEVKKSIITASRALLVAGLIGTSSMFIGMYDSIANNRSDIALNKLRMRFISNQLKEIKKSGAEAHSDIKELDRYIRKQLK